MTSQAPHRLVQRALAKGVGVLVGRRARHAGVAVASSDLVVADDLGRSPAPAGGRSAATSGRSMAGLRMSPASPPVQVTTRCGRPRRGSAPCRRGRLVVRVGVDRQQRESIGHRPPRYRGSAAAQLYVSPDRARVAVDHHPLVAAGGRSSTPRESRGSWNHRRSGAGSGSSRAVLAVGEIVTTGSFFLLPFAVGALVAAVLAFAGIGVAVSGSPSWPCRSRCWWRLPPRPAARPRAPTRAWRRAGGAGR